MTTDARAERPRFLDRGALTCESCGSHNQSELTAEVAIHFPGLKGIKKPPVWVFPKLLVCLDCGRAVLGVPEKELRILTVLAKAETEESLC